MSRSTELVTWLCARLEDHVARVQAIAPAAIVNVDTRTRGTELTSCASGLATPDAHALDLGFTLKLDGERVELSGSLIDAGSGEVLASFGPRTGTESHFDTPALREELVAFIAAQEPRMGVRLHAEARGSEHEAELIERLREQAEEAHADGEFDEACQAYRGLTMLCCDEADLRNLIRAEADALGHHLARLIEQFPAQREAIQAIAGNPPTTGA